jgi:hypothetical protein
VHQGHIQATLYSQLPVFDAAIQFTRAEGIRPAPESAHAIRAAVDEALTAREEGRAKVILFCLSGHGHFDLPSYESTSRETCRIASTLGWRSRRRWQNWGRPAQLLLDLINLKLILGLNILKRILLHRIFPSGMLVMAYLVPLDTGRLPDAGKRTDYRVFLSIVYLLVSV